MMHVWKLIMKGLNPKRKRLIALCYQFLFENKNRKIEKINEELSMLFLSYKVYRDLENWPWKTKPSASFSHERIYLFFQQGHNPKPFSLFSSKDLVYGNLLRGESKTHQQNLCLYEVFLDRFFLETFRGMDSNFFFT